MIQLNIDIERMNATYIGKLGTIPLIIFGVYWELGGSLGIILGGFTPSEETIEFSLFFDIPLILIVIGVWLSRYRLLLYLGRTGTIIWLLPFGFCSFMVLGESEHTDPIVWIEYLILLLSTVAVTFSLWKREKKEGGT